MATVLDLHFNSDVEGFSAGTWVNTAGSALIDGAAGALQVGAGVTATRDFTNITSGVSKYDFWIKSTGTSAPVSNGATVIYLLANGGTVASATSICTLALSRAASSTYFVPSYRNTSGGFTDWPGTETMMRANCFFKLSVVVDHTAKTCDVYFGDILWVRAIPWVDGTVTGFGRIAFAGQSSADPVWVDDILVESGWSLNESILLEHDFVGGSGEIESSTPTTAVRDPAPQPWKIPDNSTLYGGYTLGANGGVPDASRKCLALQRVCQEGILECEFKTSVAGTTYIGVMFRFWDYPTTTDGGGGVFRISGTNWSLFIPSRTGALTTVASGTITALSANTTYTIKVETRGRYYICSYKAAAIGAGSYTQLVAHAASSSAAGGRGMLIEEQSGPFVDTTLGATDNYVRKIRFTGAIPSRDITKQIGQFTYEVNSGSIKALLAADTNAPTRNLFFSRGIQYGHRSSSDSVGCPQSSTIYNSSHLLVLHQTAQNITEYQWLGFTNLYVTLLRRGPWVSDNIYTSVLTENFAPDLDLRPELWNKSFYAVFATGSATLQSDSTYHDWSGYGSTGVLPMGLQSITSIGSGSEILLAQMLIADTNASGSVWGQGSKFEGNGDPISRAISIGTPSLIVNTDYRVARAFLVRPGSALSSAGLEAFRDDVATPASLASFLAGSIKTDASGDTNADGFNERHGWHEISCSDGGFACTLPVSSGTRHMPAFRLHGWGAGNTALKINAAPAVEGVDYVIDDVGGGIAVLQLLSDFTSSAALQMTQEGAPSTAFRRNQSGINFYGSRR